MRSDPYTKVVLTVIALGLWALTMTQLETPHVMAASEQSRPVVSDGAPEDKPSQSVQVIEGPTRLAAAPTSTLPLRWRVSWIGLYAGASDTYCSAAVVVTNASTSDVAIEVEWVTDYGGSMALDSNTAQPYRSRVFGLDQTSVSVNERPWVFSTETVTSSFHGYALVTADDPRIIVSAFQYCRSGTGSSGPTIVAQTNIPAYPVGATAAYFQAGLPVNWTPPMAEPEVPE
jgi:hypothetical protein